MKVSKAYGEDYPPFSSTVPDVVVDNDSHKACSFLMDFFACEAQLTPHQYPTGQLYACGDSRCNENPFLTSLHTIWLREHNRLCDQLKATNPDWDDETLYQVN